MDGFEVVPESVGRCAGEWDRHYDDLIGAGRQLAHTPCTAFSPPVQVAAVLGCALWEARAAELQQGCATRADALRATIRAYLDADGWASFGALGLLAAVEAHR